MSQIANFSFPTQLPNSVPPSHSNPQHLSHPRRSDATSPYEKLRLIKDKVRQAQDTFTKQVTTHHRAQRSLDQVTRKSLIKRIEFLKIYGNKKSKYQHKELLESMKRQDEKAQRKSVQLVRRRKLENQLHHILVQNEEEDHIYRLQSKNREQKDILRRQMEITTLREQNLQRHDLIRKGNTDFLIRKKNIQTSVSMRSKHNYYSKINQQLAIIKQYESIMTEIQQFTTLQNSKIDDDSTMFRTMEPPLQTFVTNSPTKQ